MTDILEQFHLQPYQRTALPADQELALQARAAQVLTPRQMEIFQQSRSMRLQAAELQRQGLEAAKKSLGREINSWSTRGP
jgi:hypothetical protein